MKILITGASGLIGSSLVESLFKKGHTIRSLRRHKEKNWGRLWDTESLDTAEDQSPFDAVIHLAGENVANGRWNAKRKEQILRSRVDGTWELVDYISQPGKRPKVFVCASATGYYGNCGDAVVDERSPAGSGFLAEVCRQWEETAAKAELAGIRVVNVRFGMVLSPRGGALLKMLPAFKAGLGGVIGSGEQFIGWIGMRDLTEIVSFVIENDSLSGPFNVVTPNPVTNRTFVKTLGEVLGKPAIFPAPAVLVRLLFGEMADEMVLSSCRVMPAKLLDAGYRFQEEDLRQVLAACVRGSQA
ncbi:MAG: TIGR01777 family protein [Desulfobulbaceae bacterium]|nr:MAG: TIGR01777 family protein [Desulfobulbaceae bacterium]